MFRVVGRLHVRVAKLRFFALFPHFYEVKCYFINANNHLMPSFSDFFRAITTVGFCFCHHFVRTRRGGDEMGVGVARNVA